MNFKGDDILLASLLGSKIIEAVPRFSLVENELQKHVVPSPPILPFKNRVEIVHESQVYSRYSVDGQIWQADKSRTDRHFFPLTLIRNGNIAFTLPYEPLISVSGKNNIVKRNIAKAPNFVGTIKEHFSQDDYEITITGTLIGENETGDFQRAFPRADFEKLREYCVSAESLEVQCDMLQLLNIKHIVIEDFTFPFSKGGNVQAYEIKAISDFSTDFLLEIKE